MQKIVFLLLLLCRLAFAEDETLIQDVTLISPERKASVPNISVLIHNGRITKIGAHLKASPHAQRIDGRGRFLIPGLIDSHVHVGNIGPLDEDAISAHPDLVQAYHAQLPNSYLAFGFTTLVDLDLHDDTLSWFNEASVHPNLYHCGRAVRIVGGYQGFRAPKDAEEAAKGNFVYESQQSKLWPENIDPKNFTPQAAVDRVVEKGGICVKTFVEPGFGGAANWPTPLPETLNALRTETRKRGLVFIIHANAIDSWNAAMNAKADVIAHGLWHWPGDSLSKALPPEAQKVIQKAAQNGTGVQPTLQTVYGDESIFDASILDNPRLKDALPHSLIEYLKGSEGQKTQQAVADEYRQAIAKLFGASADPKTVMAIAPSRASASLQIMQKENVKLLFGSDTPANVGIGNPPGLNGRLELSRWFEAGVPLAHILRAATLDNATAFHLSRELGTIEAGKRADLLLLKENPLKTITAYDSIEIVFTNGVPIERSLLFPTK